MGNGAAAEKQDCCSIAGNRGPWKPGQGAGGMRGARAEPRHRATGQESCEAARDGDQRGLSRGEKEPRNAAAQQRAADTGRVEVDPDGPGWMRKPAAGQRGGLGREAAREAELYASAKPPPRRETSR